LTRTAERTGGAGVLSALGVTRWVIGSSLNATYQQAGGSACNKLANHFCLSFDGLYVHDPCLYLPPLTLGRFGVATPLSANSHSGFKFFLINIILNIF
jgi:hypothetical protein